MDEDIIKFTGGIPARSEKGERLLLFLGIIDILQQYKLKKKMEHAWKAAVHDGNSVSVTRPDFYKQRFLSFISDKIFPKFHAVPRPSSSSSIPAPRTVGASDMPGYSVPAGGFPAAGDVVSPNNISITFDHGRTASTSRNNPNYQRRPEFDHARPNQPATPTEATPPVAFDSPGDSVLTHDLTAGEVASETPSVHPPAFSTPTGQSQRQNRRSSRSTEKVVEDANHAYVSDVVTNITSTLCVDNRIENEVFSSLHADSNGIIAASSEVVHRRLDGTASDESQLSPFDSSASSDVMRRIQQLEDSSLNSFAGDVPSELKVASSSFLYSESVNVDESVVHSLPRQSLFNAEYQQGEGGQVVFFIVAYFGVLRVLNIRAERHSIM